MILDFSSIKHDFYGKVEQPVLTLKTPDGRIISTIPNYFKLNCTFRFNDVSEVTFSVPAYCDGEYQEIYDKITGMEQVNIEPFGDFILINPTTKNEGGTKEVKECKAYSLEYAFNHKRAELPSGTYNFYNPADNSDCIIQMITEFAPDWSIGTIDRSLIGCWRTFDTVDDNLYSFMMNTLQESYNCLFLFDTFNKKINVISANNTVSNLPIYLSYNNLLKSVEITELTDEIVTALSGYGSGDDVNIRSVNPNGTNTIYNIDYFIGKGDLPDDLTTKWLSYKENYELYRNVFSNLNVLYTQKINEKNLANAKNYVLQSEYDAINTAYLTAQTQYGENSEYDEEIENLKEQLEKKQVECDTQKEKIEQLEKEEEAINDQITEIVSVCDLNKFFTSDEMKILSQYFKQDSIAEDTFVIPEYSSAVLESSSNILTIENQATVKITGSELYASNVAEIFKPDENGEYSSTVKDSVSGEDMLNLNGSLEQINGATLPEDIAETIAQQLNDEAKRKVFEFRGGSLEFKKVVEELVNGDTTFKDVILKGDVVNADIHYNVDNLDTYVDEDSDDITKAGYFTLTATLRNASYDGVPYPNMNLSISGQILKDVPFMGEHFMAFDIESAVFYSTASTTEHQKQAVVQELYDYVKDSLDKLAQPSYEFSVESGNFIFAEEFEPFKDKLKLGSSVNLALDDAEEEIIKPILVEIELDYDDESDFSLTFSNKYRSSRSEFQLADLIQDMTYTSHSVSLNKASYSAYKDSKAGNQVDNLTNNNLDVARNKIINSSNQGMEWNSSGMFLRQLMPDGNYSPEQIGMINNMIAMTDDSWDSVKLALGHFVDKNLGDMWGIVTPNIQGTLIAGNNLIIENTILDEAGQEVIKQFKVDGSGAWLNNASFILSQEPDPSTGYAGGRILIDPRYGIAAGDMGLFTLDGTEITPAFLDEDGNIVYDESEKIETSDGTIYYVPAHTKFLFDIRTGNAYFGGDINGKNIIAQTINGNAIADYTLDASTKLTGDANADLIYKNVIAAINKYISFKKENGEPVVKMGNAVIGDLTAENFKGNKIEADTIKTDGLAANVIEAINASFGKIDADRVNIKTLDADRIIMDGENGKLVIDPAYGIAVGNSDLFTLTENENETIITPSFLDESGNLIIDSNTHAPLNSSFFFDINTGKSYFAGEISASQITSGKLSSDYMEIKDGYITNAMIENLSASKIKGGEISADVMSTNILAAINAYVGEATIDSAKIGDLSAKYMTTEEFVADHIIGDTGQFTKWLTGVNISGDIINAGTISTERLLIFDPETNDSIIYALNNGALESQTGLSEEELKRLTLNGKLITAESITADKIAANAITSEKIDAGSITAEKIASGAITADKIAAGAISSEMIEAGSITIGALDPAVKQALEDAKNDASSAQETVKGTVKNIVNEYSLSSSETEYIAYPTGYIWSTTAPTHIDGKYMWTRVKTIYVDSSISPTYSDPVCLSGAKGSKGDKGDDGYTPVKGVDYFDGNKGEDGSSSYIHIRYSANSNGSSMVSSPTSETKYIGVVTTNSTTAPTSYTSYTWSKYIGEDGIAGAKGEDGKTSYLHIAYANSSDGSVGFSVTNSENKLYIGQYTDFTSTDSTTPSDYQWTKIKGEQGIQGEQGDQGNGISSTTVTYGKSSSSSTKPSSWASSIPTVSEGEYLWTRTIIDYTDTSMADTVTYTYAKQGEKGETGTSGTSVTVSSIKYQQGDSPTAAPSGSWSNSVVSVAEGKYLWTQTTFSDGSVAYGVAKQGAKGDTGTGVQSVDVKYYKSTSSTSLSGGSWGTTAPTWEDEKYIWSKTVTTYTDNSTEESTPVCITGSKGSTGSSGSDGKGVASIIEQYYKSTSATTQSGGSWSTTYPGWEDGKYIWTRSVITYTTGDPVTTTPVCVTGSKGATGSKGDKGDAGNGISSITITYGKSTNSSTKPTSWSSTIPSVGEDEYLWTRTITDYTDSSMADTVMYTYAKQGAKGDKGETGTSGTSVTVSSIQYQQGSSPTTTPTGTWSSSVVTVAEGKYLWTKTTFSDGSIAYGVAKQGEKGDTGDEGRGISSTAVTYQASSSGTSIPSGTWSSSIPSVSAGQFLWTKTVITYTKGTPASTTSYSVGKMGTDGTNGTNGSDGRGIVSTTIAYQAGISQTTAPTGTWSSTVPTTSTDNPYLWTKTVITYTTGDPSTSYSVSSTLDSVEVGDRNLLLVSGKKQVASSATICDYEFGDEKPIQGEEYTLVMKATFGSGRTYFAGFNSGDSNSAGCDSISSSDSIGNSVYKKKFKWSGVTTDENSNTFLRIKQYPASGTSESTIEWIKLVKGNSTSDIWTPAPEDNITNIENLDKRTEDMQRFQEELKTAQDESETQINNIDIILNGKEGDDQNRGLIADNKQNKSDIDNNKKAIDSVDVKINNVNQNFQSFKSDYDAVFSVEKAGLRINGVYKDDDGAIQVADVSTLFAPNRWSFYSGHGSSATEVAYISNEKLYIATAEILQKMAVGKHVITNDNDDFTLTYEG